MKSFLALTAVLAHAASALNILLPLYIYPSLQWNDNASEWQSLLGTIAAHPSVHFDVIVNVDSGPGAGDDVNYAAGIALLSSHANVRTLGYVHTDYGRIPTDEVMANVTLWSQRPAVPGQVDGIFFDETPNAYGWGAVCSEPPAGCTDAEYMGHLTRRTRSAGFGYVAFNVGTRVAAVNEAAYFAAADQVVVFEQAYQAYREADPLANNMPAPEVGASAKANIMVHHFTDSLDALAAEVGRIAREPRVGSVWFTTIEYQDYDVAPASVENLASIIEKL